MYKLIFADDEALIRKNIEKLIEWERYGFQLIGCCENGHELMEVVEQETPDLIITDIDMPYKSGIEVARQVSQEYPWVKIIFLTGYNQFEYAQKAIDFHVQKYILKPITVANMQSILLEMKECLDQEVQKNSLINNLEKFYEMNKIELENMFLNQLLMTEEGAKTFNNKVRTLRMDYLKGDRFQAAVLAFDRAALADEWAGSDELMEFSACNIVKEILKERQIGYAIVGNGCIHILLCNAYYKNGDYREVFFQTLEEVRIYIEKYLKFTVTIGIGRVSHEVESIHLSSDESLVALGYRTTIGSNRLIYIKDIEPLRSRSHFFDLNDEKKLLTVIKSGNIEEMQEVYQQRMATLIEEQLPIEQIRTYILTVQLNLLREATHMGIDYGELLPLNQIKDIFEIWEYEKLDNLFYDFCVKLSQCISFNRKNSYSILVNQAIEIIKHEYSNPDLSINSVCSVLHLSPSYFRSIFKKETQKTFGNYLTEVRMETAKYLIETTNQKNYEIGNSVGYEDPHYFSYCFKKYFKMTPNELRAK